MSNFIPFTEARWSSLNRSLRPGFEVAPGPISVDDARKCLTEFRQKIYKDYGGVGEPWETNPFWFELVEWKDIENVAKRSIQESHDLIKFFKLSVDYIILAAV